MKKENPIVVVHECEDLPDGTWRTANSLEVPLSEAVSLIKAGKARHWEYSRGVLPPEWGGSIDVVEVEKD